MNGNIPSGTGVHQADALKPAPFCMPLGPVWVQTSFELQGILVVPYMDGIEMTLLELKAAAVQAVPLLEGDLLKIGGGDERRQDGCAAAPGHIPTAKNTALRAEVRLEVGIPTGTDAFVVAHALQIL